MCFFCLFVLLGCSKSEGVNNEVNEKPKPEEKVDNNVVAHRGAWKEFGLPDNSMAALEKAIELKCFASECDIQLTKDKKVVVYHDETIGGSYFKNITYDEVLSLGELSNGEEIPLLEEFLDTIIANKTTKLWIDVKSISDQAGGDNWSIQGGEEAAKIVESKGAQKFVSFIVGRKAVLDKCIVAAKGEWDCGYMNTEYTADQFEQNGYNWANFTYTKFFENDSKNYPEVIKEYKNKNLRVSVYTVDNESTMNWFLDQDVYAITTNHPFKLLQLNENR